MNLKSVNLPFYWGAATSAHQVEGDNTCNDWWAWEAERRVQESSGKACDHYNLYPDDFQLAADLGHNAHRFSIEWSRIQPFENVWDDAAIQHYHQVFQQLQRCSLHPMVTLHHFTSPQWFIKKGGWQERSGVDDFLKFVRRMVFEYGRYAQFWITINEPLVYLYFGYLEGSWPPGIKSYQTSIKVLRNLIEAHVQSYLEIHRYYRLALGRVPQVSIAKHVTHFAPCRIGSRLDQLTVYLRHQFFNRLFFDAVSSGFLFYPGVYCEFLAERGALDFLGVNYYMRDFIRHAGFFSDRSFGDACAKETHLDQIKERNAMGWDVYPEGLYSSLNWLKGYGLPIMICENGICTDSDLQRERFIENHLSEVRRAREEGIPVTGYFYWSLLDNFEWAHGYTPRFGLVEVDYATQRRKVRNSAYVFSKICRNIMQPR